MHANLQVKGQHSFYTGYVALGSPLARNTLAQVKPHNDWVQPIVVPSVTR